MDLCCLLFTAFFLMYGMDAGGAAGAGSNPSAYTANCDAQLTKSNFQTHSGMAPASAKISGANDQLCFPLLIL